MNIIKRDKYKKIVVLLILTLLVGCGSSKKSEDKKMIEGYLQEKYNEKFTVTDTFYNQLGEITFWAHKKGVPNNVISGFVLPVYNNNPTDTYIETKIAPKLSEEFTKELQKVIPGSKLLVKPSNARVIDTVHVVPGIDYTLDEWMDLNEKDELEVSPGSASFESVLLIPEEYEEIAFEDYSENIKKIMESKFAKLSGIWIEDVYLYKNENELKEAEELYNFGYYNDEAVRDVFNFENDSYLEKYRQARDTFLFSYHYKAPRELDSQAMFFEHEDTIIPVDYKLILDPEFVMAMEISQYMTENIQELIPSAFIWVTPSEVPENKFKNIKKGKEYTFDELLELTHKDNLESDDQYMSFKAILFANENEVDFDIDEYRSVIEDMFVEKLGVISRFSFDSTHLYGDGTDLDEISKQYKNGKYSYNDVMVTLQKYLRTTYSFGESLFDDTPDTIFAKKTKFTYEIFHESFGKEREGFLLFKGEKFIDVLDLQDNR